MPPLSLGEELEKARLDLQLAINRGGEQAERYELRISRQTETINRLMRARSEDAKEIGKLHSRIASLANQLDAMEGVR